MNVFIQIITFLVVTQVAEPVQTQHPLSGIKNLLEQDIEFDFYSSYVKNRTVDEVLLRGFCEESLRAMKCFNLDCFPCSVSSSCAMGTCCLEELIEATEDVGTYAGCMENQELGIVGCPNEWPRDDNVRQACENGTGRFTTDEPVSYLAEKLTFRNKDCAICHDIHTYVPWTRSISCKHFQYVYTAQSVEELLEKASDRISTCTISMTAPRGALTQPCPSYRKKWYSTNLIKSCNVTGKWAQRDAAFEGYCEQYQALSLRIYHKSSNHLFQNLYCAECNGVRGYLEPCSNDTGIMARDMSARRTPPLTLLLGVGDFPSRQQKPPSYTNDCSHGTWLTLTDRCHNLSCTEGKVLSVENGTCNTAVSMIRGLAYDLHITLIPKESVSLPNTERAWNNFQQRLGKTLEAKFDPSRYGEVTVSPSFTLDSKGNINIQELVMKGWMLSSSGFSRDVLENQWVENLQTDWNVTDEDISNVTFPFVYAGQPLKALYSSQKLAPTSLTFRSIWSKVSRFSLHGFPYHLSIPLTPILTCPAVKFSPSEYETKPTQGISSLMGVYLKLDGSTLTLPALSQAEVRNQTLYVCWSVLKELAGQMKPSSSVMMDFPFWEYVLNMTVIPLSIVSLFIILVIYSILPVLRTLPGLNMMGTCFTLLLAQLSVMLAVHHLVEGVWCVALGILVHLFWLSTFCWTLVSSWHMFRTFSSSTRTAKKERVLRSWGKNVVLTAIIPVVVITLVVVVSFVTSEENSIGYSDTVCYLSSPWLVGFSVVMPLCLIVVINIVLFILTVRRIQQVVNLQARDTENAHQHIKACFRLSLLTGATWIISLVGEGLGLQWLRVLSVLVNGGQGVLLLLSYVTTRRVLAMLAVRLGCRRGKGDSSTATPVTRNGSHTSEMSVSHSTDMVTKEYVTEESTM
ncbi:hypothetical protein ACOMHN_066170 [Nucella lapillus]